MEVQDSSVTVVYIGNLRPDARIGELKNHLLVLFRDKLHLNIKKEEINIINTMPKYALVDVHSPENVKYVLNALGSFEERKKIRYNFLHLADHRVSLHIDTVKSQDETQAVDQLDLAVNRRPFQKKRKGRVGRSSNQHNRSPDKPVLLNREENFHIANVDTPATRARQQSIQNLNVQDIRVPHDNYRDPIGQSSNIITNERMQRVPNNIARAPSVSSGYPGSTDLDIAMDEDGGTTDGFGTEYDQGRVSRSTGRDSRRSRASQHSYQDPTEVVDYHSIRRSRKQAKSKRTVVVPHEKRIEKSVQRNDFVAFLDEAEANPSVVERITHKKIILPKRRPTDIQEENEEEDDDDGDDDGDEEDSEEDSEDDSDEVKYDDDEESVVRDYYVYKEKLGNETRSREFKAAQGSYMMSKLRKDVSRYICGFLNSGERGTLYLGVDDDGSVLGVDCDQAQEDRYRIYIDESIKDIRPLVFPEDYTVTFVPVVKDNELKQLEHNKLVVITVLESESRNELFENHEGVFVRRDGSLEGPVKAGHIQEWTKRRFQDQINKLQKKEHRLRNEVTVRDSVIRKQTDTIIAQQDEINRQRVDIAKSKACVIL